MASLSDKREDVKKEPDPLHAVLSALQAIQADNQSLKASLEEAKGNQAKAEERLAGMEAALRRDNEAALAGLSRLVQDNAATQAALIKDITEQQRAAQREDMANAIAPLSKTLEDTRTGFSTSLEDTRKSRDEAFSKLEASLKSEMESRLALVVQSFEDRLNHVGNAFGEAMDALESSIATTTAAKQCEIVNALNALNTTIAAIAQSAQQSDQALTAKIEASTKEVIETTSRGQSATAEIVAEAVGGLYDKLDRFDPQQVANQFSLVGPKVAAAVKALEPMAANLLAASLEGVQSKLEETVQELGDVAHEMKGGIKENAMTARRIESAAASIEQTGDNATQSLIGIQDAASNFKSLANGLDRVMKEILNSIREGKKNHKDLLDDGLRQIHELQQKSVNALSATEVALIQGIQAQFAASEKTFGEFGEGLTDFLKRSVEAVRETASKAEQAATKAEQAASQAEQHRDDAGQAAENCGLVHDEFEGMIDSVQALVQKVQGGE